MALTGIATLAKFMINAKNEAVFFAKPAVLFFSVRTNSDDLNGARGGKATSGGLGAETQKSPSFKLFTEFLIYVIFNLVFSCLWSWNPHSDAVCSGGIPSFFRFNPSFFRVFRLFSGVIHRFGHKIC